MNTWRKNLKIFSLLTAFLLTNAVLVTAFHHHEPEAKTHAPCEVCSLAQQTRFADQTPSVSTATPYLGWVQIFSLYDSIQIAPYSFALGKLSQAPPVA